jgi:hypothetical protein
MTTLEMRVSHVLGWQAGTVEVRETIREFRLGKRPYDRYTRKQIDELTQIISPPQGITATKAVNRSRIPNIGGK